MSASVLPGDRLVSALKSGLWVWIQLLAALVASALSGCGGGGGGDSGTDKSAQLQVSPLQITVTAQTTDPAPTSYFQASVQLTRSVTAGTKYYIAWKETHNGIASVSGVGSVGADNGSVTFAAPATLGPGTYSDTITIKGCDDQACTRQMTNSPQTIVVTYKVTLPIPQVYSITPNSATAGAPSLQLALNGSNFLSQSVVLWNGSPLTTTFVSANQLTAQVPTADLAVAGTYSVTVSNGNGSVSSTSPFVVAPLPPLALNSIWPTQVTAGGSDFMLSAIGTGFSAAASITWNGANLPTVYVSSTLLRAKVTAAQIASVGTVAITVAGAGTPGVISPMSLTIVPANTDAVSYQMNPAHTGAVTFKTIALPSTSAWSVDVGGNPSYALIVGQQVFVTVAVNGNSELLALNGTTGATLWGPIAFSGNVNAAYDNGRLFVVSGGSLSQVISSLDPATGNALWSATVGGSWFPEPPVAAGGIVYTTNGGLVTAYDEATGATLWQKGIGGTDGIVAVTVDGLYGASPCTALNLQPAVGTQIWYNNSGCSGGGGATPVVANGLMYAPVNSAGSSGNVFDAETGAVKGSYSASVIPAFSSSSGFFLNNGTLQGLALSNNQILWSFAGDGQLSSAPIVVNNYVFIGSGNGNLYALDAVSGQQVWSQNLGAAIPSSGEYGVVLYTGLAAGDGLLVVPNGTKVTAFVLSTSP
jgi:outer membrane protein assembly factor BamB